MADFLFMIASLQQLVRVRLVVISGFLAITAWLFWRGKTPDTLRCEGQAMGCSWTLLYRQKNHDPSILTREIQQVLDHWENVMSTWKENSDLSRHNRGEKASADLQRVLDLAEQMRVDSRGAFDARLLDAVHRARFAPAGKGIDLSGIGKGFAVDRVAEMLRARGINDFLFQLAGETIAGDRVWEVGVEAPDPASRRVTKTIWLQNQAMATSGNYRQFRHSDQGVQSHIIDPRTGRPVIRGFSAVTVIAHDAATADAWATALFVNGARSGPSDTQVFWQE
jgi:thiamine biosynthesis lipoprotein